MKFDARSVEGAGFTSNVSPTGMLVHSKLTSTPGSVVRGQIFLAGGGAADFEAEVRWVQKATGLMAQLVQSSMGLKFVVPPSEDYFQLLAKFPTSL